MNKVYFLSILLMTLILSSCSDTVVVENKPDGSANAPAISGYFKKRVLIEDYTGTWCGNCTRVAYAIDQVNEQTDKAVSVAIHNGNDPYDFAGIAPLKNLILPNSPLALPVSRLNRTLVWTFPEPTNIQEALDLTSNNSTLGLAMSSTVSNGTLNLDVKMKFVEDYSNLKLVVYLLEDHLIYYQRNYTNYYNAVNPILDYEHNHVLRSSLTNILGDEINGAINGSTITKNFSIPIPSNIANPTNISFVAFLVGSDNKALNARASKANENQTFEINP
ncbi:Omp28-related outer membrane protein [Flavobacterium sp.]|uniref:Omp28-related outer membrane protein n=1 Tax=Flavobacterium sp. TaxID=239 RepID=UPI003751B769